MERLLSFVADPTTMKQFNESVSFQEYIHACGLDGIELIRCGAQDRIPKELIKGIHLPYSINWMDYWLGHKEELLKEYSSEQVIKTFFPYEPKEYWRYFSEDFEYAEEFAEYAVFHISNTRFSEYSTGRSAYSSQEIIDQSANVINDLIQNSSSKKKILIENLYGAGLNLSSPNQLDSLLNQVDSDRVAMVLDTGHLMCTGSNLTKEKDAWDYVKDVIEKMGSLKSVIEVLHLNVSLQNEVPVDIKSFWKSTDDFWKNFERLYEVMGNIDQHSWVTNKKVLEVIDFIEPKKIVFEYRGVQPKNRRKFFNSIQWIR